MSTSTDPAAGSAHLRGRALVEWGAEHPEWLATMLTAAGLPHHVRAHLYELHSGLLPYVIRVLEAAGDRTPTARRR